MSKAKNKGKTNINHSSQPQINKPDTIETVPAITNQRFSSFPGILINKQPIMSLTVGETQIHI